VVKVNGMGSDTASIQAWNFDILDLLMLHQNQPFWRVRAYNLEFQVDPVNGVQGTRSDDTTGIYQKMKGKQEVTSIRITR